MRCIPRFPIGLLCFRSWNTTDFDFAKPVKFLKFQKTRFFFLGGGTEISYEALPAKLVKASPEGFLHGTEALRSSVK